MEPPPWGRKMCIEARFWRYENRPVSLGGAAERILVTAKGNT